MNFDKFKTLLSESLRICKINNFDVKGFEIARSITLIGCLFFRILEIVQFLVQQPGIDLNLTNKDGKSPLSIAQSKGFSEIEELISEKIGKTKKIK